MGVKRPNAAELQRQSVKPRKCGPTKPQPVRAAVELEALIKAIQGRYVVAVEVNHCVSAVNSHPRIGLLPVLVVPDCRNHFCLDFAHKSKPRNWAGLLGVHWYVNGLGSRSTGHALSALHQQQPSASGGPLYA